MALIKDSFFTKDSMPYARKIWKTLRPIFEEMKDKHNVTPFDAANFTNRVCLNLAGEMEYEERVAAKRERERERIK